MGEVAKAYEDATVMGGITFINSPETFSAVYLYAKAKKGDQTTGRTKTHETPDMPLLMRSSPVEIAIPPEEHPISPLGILPRLQENDPVTWETFVTDVQKKAHTIIKSLGVSTNDLDDIFQNALLNFHLHIDTMENTNPLGYFFTAVKNASLDWLKRRKNHISLSQKISSSPEIENAWTMEDVLPSNDDFIDAIDKRNQLTTLYDARSKGSLILLFSVQGYSHKEIAEKTGLTLSTVKMHIFRERQRVREQQNPKTEHSPPHTP